MRRRHAAWFAALALLGASCTKPEAPADRSIEAAPSDRVQPEKREARAPERQADDQAEQPGARRREVPHEESKPDEPERPEEKDEPAPKRKHIGAFEDWVKAYEGLGEPDTSPPPRLGVLPDLTALAESEMVYCRSGHLVRVSLPSGEETQLSSGAFHDADPRWTRDGRWLFFVSNREGSVGKIFRQRWPDGKAEAVTRALQVEHYAFSWAVSGDGSKVAYIDGQSEPEGKPVTVVDVASHGESVVHRAYAPEDPYFTKNGRKLLVVAGGVMAERITSIDLSTLEATTLPSLKHDETGHISELPDGRLLFASSAGFSMADRSPALYTMPQGGGAWSRLGSYGMPAGYLHPNPSPDGKKIAARWSRRTGGFGADWHSDIAILSASGEHLFDLASSFPRPFYGVTGGSWAPDSRHLAATLTLCPYAGCEPSMQSVVLVDTGSRQRKLVFVGHGGQAAFRPRLETASASGQM